MLLYYTKTSPFARKVRLLVLELGLENAVLEVDCDPFKDEANLRKINPLGKIPVLITDSGIPVYDSPVICEYLLALSAGSDLLPGSDPEKLSVKLWETLCDGVMESAFLIVMERRKPKLERSAEWKKRWYGDVQFALEKCEKQLTNIGDSINLAHLALGAALGYLDFRLGDFDWRDKHRSIASWYAELCKRPSMKLTRPD